MLNTVMELLNCKAGVTIAGARGPRPLKTVGPLYFLLREPDWPLKQTKKIERKNRNTDETEVELELNFKYLSNKRHRVIIYFIND